MMKNSFLVACSVFFLFSCNTLINEDQHKKLDTLSFKVDSSLQVLNDIDSSKIAIMNQGYLSSKDYLLDSLKDTVDNKTIFFLDSFMRLKKPIGFLMTKYSPLKREAQLIQVQILNLGKDVQNKHVDEEHFENYYLLEKANYLQLEDAVIQITRVYNTSLSQYDRMKPKIDSIIIQSKSKVND